ncbi:MAG TPA: restriction endonuclease [Jiangellaceae bacterium]|nr:restriction endonuclease [Jiangellaceae bacterium]
MTHYNDGRRFEYKVRDALAADGYEVIRSAGSKGKVDLVAFKRWLPYGPSSYHMLFVQVKRRDGNIGREDRAELIRLANMAGAVPVVAHQPQPRRPIQYRRLTGPGPRQWQPWTPDEVGA